MAGLLGIVGGMTWRSTLEYYRLANEQVADLLGEPHSARVLVNSLDFGDILTDLAAGRPDRVGSMIADAARTLDAAGADAILLAANTAHRWFPQVVEAVSCPVIHVAEPVLDAAAIQKWHRLAVMATSSTITSGVYSLAADYGIEIVAPGPEHQHALDELIFTQLARRAIQPGDMTRCEPVLQELLSRGAQAVLLGCTELHPLATAFSTICPVLDSTALHANRAVDMALGSAKQKPAHDGGY